MPNQRVLEGMTINFNETLSEERKVQAFEQIQRDYYRLKDFLYPHGLWNTEKLASTKVQVELTFFGQYTGWYGSGTIKLFGVNQRGLFIHELIHLLLPSNQIRFSEGLADYIQSLLAEDKSHWGDEPIENIAPIHLNHPDSQKYDNYFDFILTTGNYNDHRLNKCYFAHSVAHGYVQYLIETLGFTIYLEKYHQYKSPKENPNQPIHPDEVFIFNKYWESVKEKKVNPENYDQYFLAKQKLYAQWEPYYAHGVARAGHPLQKWDAISEGVQKEAFDLFLKEQKLDMYPANPEHWAEPSECT